MARIDKLSIELEAVELINIMRGLFNYSFRQLSEILDVPESVLCRYANGDILPSSETAMNIVKKLENKLELPSIMPMLIKNKGDYIDLSNVIFNPYVLKLYEKRVQKVFGQHNITSVVTVATDGIPLAVVAASALRARLTIAKQYKDAGFEDFYEASYIVDSPPRRVSIYLPRELLGKKDKVLIVDDIMRTGRTVDALLSIIDEAGADIGGFSILVARQNGVLDFIRSKVTAPIDVLYLQ